MDTLELLFLGTGTSAGVPMIGCHCETCSSTDPHDKRTRPSVVISYAGQHILIDSTPELRLQCIANGVDRIDAVVYTHGHADHIMGLDDLRRFNAITGKPLDLWADAEAHTVLNRCFGYAFKEPDPTMKLFRPHLIRKTINGPFKIAGQKWTPIPLLHGTMPVLGFRIGHLAYCTDVSEIPESSFDLLHDLDVLILDALQHKKHTTHFSVEEAVAAAQRTGAKATYFTHIAHAIKHQTTSAMLPPNIHLGYDGLTVSARTAN